MVLTRYLLRAIRLFFQRVGEGSISIPGFDSDWALPTDRIVRLLTVAFALVIAYPYIPGSGSEAFKGITLLLGLIFSLGSPSVISNLVAGQTLAFRRAFRVGDRVKVGEHVGRGSASPFTDDLSALSQERADRHPQLADPEQGGGELQHPGAGSGTDPAYDREDRLWRAVASGGSDIARGRRAHAGASPAARAVRAAEIVG